MSWKKSPPELVALFESMVPDDPQVERKQMFGYPCFFVNSNLAVGLHQDDMILRLSDEARARFLKIVGGHLFEPTPGRVMREYVVVPKGLRQNPEILRKWVAESVAYARAVTPKAAKPSVAQPVRQTFRPAKGGKPGAKPVRGPIRPLVTKVEIKKTRRIVPPGGKH